MDGGAANLRQAELIDTPRAFAELIASLRNQPVVGLDTEAASFHKFRDRIYLLQISSPDRTAVVDPLAVGGLSPLKEWLSDSATEFVFHDADYDLRLFYHEYGLRITKLFDTRVAAQFLNLPSIGLAALLEQRYQVKTDKRFQRADWSLRPLSPEMVEYAATDTHYLPRLREAFRSELAQMDRLSWVEEECELSRTVEWAPPEPPEVSFLRMKGARDLDRRGLAVLRELVVWREQTAALADRALFRVLANETLLLLAARRPVSLAELEGIRGVGRDTMARRAADILAAVQRGLSVPDSALPAFERRPRFRPDPRFEARVDRLKQWRVGLATRVGLPPGLLLPNATVEAVARTEPSSARELLLVPGIRRWQVGEFGAELLAMAAAP